MPHPGKSWFVRFGEPRSGDRGFVANVPLITIESLSPDPRLAKAFR